ncbi:MAG TPA: bifunctional DNA-formamidopyrimidine glycosylase/DNA-(apurinic or apyrimidinic site) lyase [Solirubrobacterales bacterium]|jgi:formamidopyrimidine-DNA glycosylase|nr:bifunctional DNA-formamidopyrimidine glycosylase/DNA-(apurinic or apyrimidinic site) lyase [Solirubrobacterales bacterium]
MPELPEVETVRRQLAPEVTGRRIESAEILDERLTRPEDPTRIARRLAGREIEGVDRRGKYLLLRLEGGGTLALHLRMTGNLLLRRSDDGDEVADLMERDRLGGPRLYEAPPELRHLRASLELDDGSELLFTDMRRFGTAVLLEDRNATEDYLASRVGIEPLSEELTPEALCRLAAGRTIPLKSFLLTQTAISGIGNIYADEALWRARLHPLSPAGSMKLEHCEALVEGTVDALEAGLEYGGASIDDYRDARGEKGSMQDEFMVHTREGKPCPRGDGTIERIVVGGRSSYLCPACQVKLRRRPRRRRKRAGASRAAKSGASG